MGFCDVQCAACGRRDQAHRSGLVVPFWRILRSALVVLGGENFKYSRIVLTASLAKIEGSLKGE